MPDVSVLEVKLHGRTIGTLTHVGADRTLFAFTDAYIADRQRPTLSLAFKDEFGQLVTDFLPHQRQVEPFFSNLLPEGQMRTWLAARAGVKPEREFFLLWVLGPDLPGAVEIAPADGQAWPSDAADGDNADTSEEGGRHALRFSLAGVQIKFSAVQDGRRGLTIPAKGVGGSWIVKLPPREFHNVPEAEYAMLTLAAKLGINVPAIRLVDTAGIGNLPEDLRRTAGQSLAIERFDRTGDGGKVHIEDFAQVFDQYPQRKYERASYAGIARVLAIETPDDVPEFVRRVAFNVLIGNGDMHMKNWSLAYPDRRHPRLAPAYDFVPTVAFMQDRTTALNVARLKRFDRIDLDDFARLAARAMLPEKPVLDAVRETVALFHQHWAAEKNHLPLAAKAVAAIDAHLRTIPLARQ
ncbi:MAG: type II toxin-antitoxin system HipA family toxin [Reyranellaceae bacterium]